MATILIVEDNEPSRDALARRLERRGYRRRCRRGRTEAVSVAQSDRPDLILMDLGPAGHRRLGGHAPVERRCRDPPHPDHRAQRARDDQRPRAGARRRRRRLRYEAGPVSATAREDRVAAGQRRCREVTRHGSLLVVDDNEANRDALSRRLRQRGYLVDRRGRRRGSAGAGLDRRITTSSCWTSKCRA